MMIAYIAHPINGDVQGNIKKIIKIIQTIYATEPDVVPFVPYLGDVMALNDDDWEMRQRGIKNNKELFIKTDINEVRLYGDRISDGMMEEIRDALTYNIRIIPMTPKIKKALHKLI